MSFTEDQIMEAVAVVLAKMRTEQRASEQRLRDEYKTEIAKLRAEWLQGRPVARDTKWKPLPVPDAMIA